MEGNENTESAAKGGMWDLQQKFDQPMDEEASRLKNMHTEKRCSAMLLVQLAFQSLGVVYGDLGTSPLYVFYNTFPKGIDDTEDVVGALSLIIYSLTLVPLIKYVFIVCRANDNGQGGTFALYSLLCRHAKVKTIPNQHRTDEKLTTYSLTPINENSVAAMTKRWLEAHALKKNALLVLVLVGTCMVIGDGILTPAISDVIVVVAVCILVGLFCLQHYGPDKVGWFFAPIVLLWFLLIGGIGIFNILKHDTMVLRAFSPIYIFWYFRRRGEDAWTSLGGIMLSITGTEALFADLAHFPHSAIQLAFTTVVFPCLLLAYCGQAAYLMKNKEHVYDTFYHSIPGTAVVVVMLVTTLLMILIMLLVWRCHWILVLIFTILSLVVECTYFSAVLCKIDQGAWVPLAIAVVFLVIMHVWHYGTVKRYELEMQSKISLAWILNLGPSLGLVRVPGIGLVYSELVSGVPRIFSHFITNLPAIHSVVVLVCIKSLPVYTVPEEERFLVKRLGPKNYHMFSVFLFAKLESLMDASSDSDEYSLYGQETISSTKDTFSSVVDITVSSWSESSVSSEVGADEMAFLKSCRDAGVVHIMGNTIVEARRDSGIYKKI
ncbi:potassium transporter, partial [Cynara cardunculus var. scolymus]